MYKPSRGIPDKSLHLFAPDTTHHLQYVQRGVMNGAVIQMDKTWRWIILTLASRYFLITSEISNKPPRPWEFQNLLLEEKLESLQFSLIEFFKYYLHLIIFQLIFPNLSGNIFENPQSLSSVFFWNGTKWMQFTEN